MKACVSTTLHWCSLAAFCFVLGCPQLADDRFSTLATSAGSGGALGQGGTAGTGATPPAGGADSGAVCVPGSPRNCPANGGSGGSGPKVDAAKPPACTTEEREGPGGRCYFAQTTELSWQAARTSCQARGAGWDLATIQDQQDDDFVDELVGYEAWLAGTDTVLEATWVWVTDGAEFYQADSGTDTLYTNWNSGEPNNLNDSDCLRILTTGFWADLECGSLKGSVCAADGR